MTVSLEDILNISPTEGRRGLEKAQAIVKQLLAVKKGKPGKVEKTKKVIE